MTTPAQLMSVLAEVTEVPLATIVDHDRKLTAAGLRTKAGRGRNVARLTAFDAARLLTALLVSPRATNAAEAVARYTQTHPDKASSSDVAEADELDEFPALTTARNFVEALAVVIAAAANGSPEPIKSRGVRIEVYAMVGETRGRIRITGLTWSFPVTREFVATVEPKAAIGSRPRGDLEQSCRVSERTIFAIAKLLEKES